MSLALVLTLFASACTGGGEDDPDGPPKPAPLPPEMEVQWRSGAGPDTGGGALPETLPVWAIEEQVVVVQDSEVTGLDRATGEPTWELPMPGGKRVCAASASVNNAGIGGLLIGRGDACNEAVAIDTTTGKLQWTRSLGKQDMSDLKVAVGESTLTARATCDEVRRFAIVDGKPRSTWLPQDRKCGHESDLAGGLVAALNDPETAETADDHGTGIIPPSDEPAAFELHDADTGKVRWRRAVNSLGSNLNRIVSTDPLILDFTENGYRLLRTIGPDGKPGAVIGKRLDDVSTPARVLGVVDDLVIVHYASDAVRGYDVTTGEQRWVLPVGPGETVLGLQDDRLITMSDVIAEDRDDPDRHLVLAASDARTGTDTTVLGRLPDDSGLTLRPALIEGDLLLGVDPDSDLVALPLPADGKPSSAYALADYPTVEWKEGEIRPDDTVDACDLVRPETLKLVGFHRPDLPATSGCGWEERYQPGDVTRQLRAVVTANTSIPDRTATAAATQYLAGIRKNDTGQPSRDYLELGGLGDEAWLATDTRPGRMSSAHLVARHRNVTFEVHASFESDDAPTANELAPQHLAERAVIEVASDLIEGLGGTVDVPKPGADGTITKAKPVCGPLAGEAATLVPGAQTLDMTPVGAMDDGRVAGCFWADDWSPALEAWVYAVPGGTDGHSADEVAAAYFAAQTKGALSIKGLGDRASLDSYDDGDYHSPTVTVLRNNLLVVVEYSAHAPSGERLEAAAQRVARKVLAAY